MFEIINAIHIWWKYSIQSIRKVIPLFSFKRSLSNLITYMFLMCLAHKLVNEYRKNQCVELLCAGRYPTLFYFHPFCPYSSLGNLKLCKFQFNYIQLYLFKHNYVWAMTRQGKIDCKCRTTKITWGKKKTLYSNYFPECRVCIIAFWSRKN